MASEAIVLERRLWAACLILTAAVPILLTHLPRLPPALLATLAFVAVAVACVLLPLDARIQRMGAALSCAWLVLFGIYASDAEGTGAMLLIPTVLLVLEAGGLALVLAGAGAAVLALVSTRLEGGPDAVLASASSLAPSDLLGWVAAVMCLVAAATTLGPVWRTRAITVGLIATADALDDATRTDHAELDAIARAVGLRVRGQGFEISAPLDEEGKRTLITELRGSPVSVLSTAWALWASARAGADPALLRRWLAEVLDEWSPTGSTGDIAIVPRSNDEPPRDPTTELLALEPVAKTLPHLPTLREKCLECGGLALGAAVLAAAALPTVVAGASLRIGLSALVSFGVPWLLAVGFGAWRERVQSRRDAIEDAVDARIDARDDLHHALAHLHGVLLPYRASGEGASVRAHRLRGEVLEGGFADLLELHGGAVIVLAGEVAGEGIAARFLGLAAQMSLRTQLARADRFDGTQSGWAKLERQVAAELAPVAALLSYPLHLRLGLVFVDSSGDAIAHGSLAPMIVRTRQRVSLVAQADLRGGAEVFLTPSGSRPGPEDEAPALESTAAAARLLAHLESTSTEPVPSLASLFSAVFDGEAAPAHGTLITLAGAAPLPVRAAS